MEGHGWIREASLLLLDGWMDGCMSGYMFGCLAVVLPSTVVHLMFFRKE